MINNRQGGRRRGRGGQRPQGNPGQPGGGNRIDNRARGNAQQLHEKYKNLARDAQMSGDRVTTEYYLQFADHYFRVLNENRARFEDQRRPRDETEEEFEGEEFDAREPRRENAFRREERAERAPEEPAEAAGGEAQAEERNEDDQRRGRRNRRRREDGEASEGLEVDRLPPAIAVETNTDDEPPAPRRRGRRPRAETVNDTLEVPPAA